MPMKKRNAIISNNWVKEIRFPAMISDSLARREKTLEPDLNLEKTNANTMKASKK
ncbi:MAG: hypothetical protein J5U17_00685 [Candidatus Methanoperedens sp.]|nr:hypothetical protein [Candidatus Methanoperedens sp.]